jgi:hypothetical protein
MRERRDKITMIGNLELVVCSAEVQAKHPELFHYTKPWDNHKLTSYMATYRFQRASKRSLSSSPRNRPYRSAKRNKIGAV